MVQVLLPDPHLDAQISIIWPITTAVTTCTLMGRCGSSPKTGWKI